MPTYYIQKISNQTGQKVSELEKKWKKAKEIAKENNKEENWAYITSIFQQMIGEK